MEMLHAAQNACDADGHPVECLFSLVWNGAWAWYLPNQEQTATSVRVLEDAPNVLEGHSHHGMRAYFSSTDDIDEIVNGGFCPYFVLGCVHSAPEIVMRICAHGYSWHVPARWFLALPASLMDRGLWTEECGS